MLLASFRGAARAVVLLGALHVAQPAALGAQARMHLPLDVCALTDGGPGTVRGAAWELSRLFELSGESPQAGITMRRGSTPSLASACDSVAVPPAAWSTVALGPVVLELAPARAESWYNSGYPVDRDNGLVWTGRGMSTSGSAGIRLRAGPVSAAYLPEFAFQQNADFTIDTVSSPGFPAYANPFYRTIDLPQRMGTGSSSIADLAGQSYLRVDAYGIGAGISHENYLIGPGIRNQIMMSASAPGFTHLFLGTSRPIDIWIGHAEAHVVIGRLEESDHFDAVEGNDRSSVAQWTVGFRPRILPGLEVGVARVYQSRMARSGELFDFDALFDVLALGSSTNLEGNELASLFARWLLPESGASVYAEWARNDRFAGFMEDFVPEPDHSQAYTIGLEKLTPFRGGMVRVLAELNHLQEKGEPRHDSRPLNVLYLHSVIRQGYTHHGQILGAGIGPGADAQFIGVDWIDDWGLAGIFVERVRRNDASAAAIAARRNWPYEHDTELTGGLRGMVPVADFLLSGSFSWSYRLERDFIEDDSNLQLVLSAEWRP